MNLVDGACDCDKIIRKMKRIIKMRGKKTAHTNRSYAETEENLCTQNICSFCVLAQNQIQTARTHTHNALLLFHCIDDAQPFVVFVCGIVCLRL